MDLDEVRRQLTTGYQRINNMRTSISKINNYQDSLKNKKESLVTAVKSMTKHMTRRLSDIEEFMESTINEVVMEREQMLKTRLKDINDGYAKLVQVCVEADKILRGQNDDLLGRSCRRLFTKFEAATIKLDLAEKINLDFLTDIELRDNTQQFLSSTHIARLQRLDSEQRCLIDEFWVDTPLQCQQNENMERQKESDLQPVSVQLESLNKGPCIAGHSSFNNCACEAAKVHHNTVQTAADLLNKVNLESKSRLPKVVHIREVDLLALSEIKTEDCSEVPQNVCGSVKPPPGFTHLPHLDLDEMDALKPDILPSFPPRLGRPISKIDVGMQPELSTCLMPQEKSNTEDLFSNSNISAKSSGRLDQKIDFVWQSDEDEAVQNSSGERAVKNTTIQAHKNNNMNTHATSTLPGPEEDSMCLATTKQDTMSKCGMKKVQLNHQNEKNVALNSFEEQKENCSSHCQTVIAEVSSPNTVNTRNLAPDIKSLVIQSNNDHAASCKKEAFCLTKMETSVKLADHSKVRSKVVVKEGVASNQKESVHLRKHGKHRVLDLSHLLEQIDGSGQFEIRAKCIEKIRGDFEHPIGVTTNSKGDVIVADTGNNLVKICNNGRVITKLGADLKMRRPSAVIVNEKDEIFVKDDHCLYHFDANGNFIKTMGKKEMSTPYGLGITKQGQLVVVDCLHTNPRLHIFQKDGILESFPYEPLRIPIANSKCRFLAVFGESVLTSDLGLSCLYLTNLKGEQEKTLSSWGKRPGQVWEPAGVAVDAVGNWIVADSKNHRAQVFAPNGYYMASVHFIGESIRRPSGIHLTSDGLLYVINYVESVIKVFKLESSSLPNA